MVRRFLSPLEIAIALGATIVSLILFFVHAANPLSTPDSAVHTAIATVSQGNLDQLQPALTETYYQNFAGHFGERRFLQARAVYDEAYARATPVWMEYRRKAESLSRNAYSELQAKIERLGKDAVNSLPLDERMKLTEDRQKYAALIFDEGVKALSPEERARIGGNGNSPGVRNLSDKSVWDLLPEEDRAAMGSPAVLASGITPEKTTFFERTGLPLLKPEQRKAIEGISSADLSNPTAFMVRYGRDSAKQYLATVVNGATLVSLNCFIRDEKLRGSLIQGPDAGCESSIAVRYSQKTFGMRLQKTGGSWRISEMYPALWEAYPPPPPRRAAVAEELAAAPPSPPSPGVVNVPRDEPIQVPAIPNARWQNIPEPIPPAEAGGNRFLEMFLPGSVWSGLVLLTFITLIAVKTFNYIRKLAGTEQPALLEDEKPVRTVSLRNYFSKSVTQLTDRRVLQGWTWWWLSRRSADSIHLADVQAIFWRKRMSLPLLIVGIALIGRMNPLALLLIMAGVEAKIYSVVFRRAFFHLPNSGIVVRTSRRSRYAELWSFFQLAQLHWLAQKGGGQIGAGNAKYADVGPDRDFRFGLIVWVSVAAAMLTAMIQRWIGHVTLYDILLGSILMALPMIAGRRGIRDGLLTAVFAFTALLCVKFPDLVPFAGMPLGPDGRAVNPVQYFEVLLTFCLVAVAAALLGRAAAQFASLALLLWIVFACLIGDHSYLDISVYARVALSIGVGLLLSGAFTAFLDRPQPPAASSASI